MDNFSERNKFKEKPDIQTEGISDELRIKLWNVLSTYLDKHIRPGCAGYGDRSTFNKRVSELVAVLLCDFFSVCRDNLSECDVRELKKKIHTEYAKLTWYEVYDFLEFIIKNMYQYDVKGFIKSINDTLAKNNSGYRLDGGIFIPIFNPEQLDSIHKTENNVSDLAITHFKKAKKYLSPTKHDYENSIKEAVSAIESELCSILDNRHILSKNIKNDKLKEDIHPSILIAIDKLYGFASDTVRHGNSENDYNVGKTDAEFILVVSSALLNFMTSKLK